MLGAVFILFLVVGVFTGLNIQQTEQSVSRLLAERGNAIIEFLESSLRNDLLRTRFALRTQELVEALATNDDIVFIALVLDNGEIIAHSNPARVGQRLLIGGAPADEETLRKFHEQEERADGRTWSIARLENRRVFSVHRPLFRLDRDFTAIGPWGGDRPALPPTEHVPLFAFRIDQIQAFVGHNMEPLIAMQERTMRSSLLSGMLVLLTALTGLLALRYFERGMESRRRMRVAETLAKNMVDEVKRLEKEVRRREKLAAVGDLAAGVAHELRNPLSSIKGYATYFISRFPEDSEDRKAAQIMVGEVERLNRAITDLIGLSRPTDIRPQAVNMGKLAGDTLRLIARDAWQRGVSTSWEGDTASAWIDPDRFRQVLLNVCLNALEAMEKGGNLEICFSHDDKHVFLDVRDTGPGIPPEIIGRVFDPYFTTKSQGTGLGLFLVLKVAEAHNGTVQITSEPGKGTIVHFTLPSRPPAARKGRAAAAPSL